MREILLHTESPALRHGVVVLSSGGAGAPTLKVAGIPVYEPAGEPHSRLAQMRHVSSAIEAFEPDLLTTAVFDADLVGRLAALRSGIPVLTSLVNTIDPDAMLRDIDLKRWKLAGVRFVDAFLAWGATSAFHAITGAVAKDASRRLRIASGRISVVPRGRDRSRLGARDYEKGAELRAELGIDRDAAVLLNIAREEPQKGQVHLIRAVHRMRAERPDLHVLMAGRPGRASAQLDAETTALGVDDAVHRLGYRSDIGVLHGAADIFVFPSNYEGLGGAVLEAMALGTPVVATAIPALTEVLDDGACGVLVPPADPAALSEGLLRAFNDPEATQKRVDAASCRFDEQYTIERCAAEMARLYIEAASLRPPVIARWLRSHRRERVV